MLSLVNVRIVILLVLHAMTVPEYNAINAKQDFSLLFLQHAQILVLTVTMVKPRQIHVIFVQLNVKSVSIKLLINVVLAKLHII